MNYNIKNESLYGQNSFSISSVEINYENRKEEENKDDLISQGVFTNSNISL